MRKVLLVLALVAALLGLGLSDPEFVGAAHRVTGRLSDKVLYEREIRWSGLETLAPEDLGARRLSIKSNFWWEMNTSAVEAELLRGGLLSSAAVHRCSGLRWACFEIGVQERKPAALVALKDQIWLVGHDAGYMLPLAEDRARALLDRLPLLSGVTGGELSPEAARGRLEHALRATARIEKAAALDILNVEVRADGELQVRFRSSPVSAVFSADPGLDRIDTEAQRLRRIMDEFDQGAESVAQIDLAFDRVAVVKLSN